MVLYLPAGIRQIAADKKHPWYNPQIDVQSLVVFVDGDEITQPITVADEINGYVKFLKVGTQGEIEFDDLDRIRTTRRKGKVQIYIRKDGQRVDQTQRQS